MSDSAKFASEIAKNTDEYVNRVQQIRKELATVCLTAESSKQKKEALIKARKRMDSAKARLTARDQEVFEQYICLL